jgi:hypothetical protein
MSNFVKNLEAGMPVIQPSHLAATMMDTSAISFL